MSGRRQGLRAIAALVGTATKPALAKRGFAAARIIADWSTIVGEPLARASIPERLVRDPKTETATLVIKVSSGIALELQHLEPLVIERINSHFGFRAVTKLRLIQGPVPVVKVPDAAPAPLPVKLGDTVEARLARLGDDDLREALGRLGQAVARHRRPNSS